MIANNALRAFQLNLAENRVALAQDPNFQWPSLFDSNILITQVQLFEELAEVRDDQRRDIDPTWPDSPILNLNPYEKAEVHDGIEKIRLVPQKAFSDQDTYWVENQVLSRKERQLLRFGISAFNELATVRTENYYFQRKHFPYKSVWLKAKLREWGIDDPEHMIDSSFGDTFIENFISKNLILFKDVKVSEQDTWENLADCSYEQQLTAPYLGGAPSDKSIGNFGTENTYSPDVAIFRKKIIEEFPRAQRAYYYDCQSLDALVQSGFSAQAARKAFAGGNKKYLTPTDVFSVLYDQPELWFFVNGMD